MHTNDLNPAAAVLSEDLSTDSLVEGLFDQLDDLRETVVKVDLGVSAVDDIVLARCLADLAEIEVALLSGVHGLVPTAVSPHVGGDMRATVGASRT